MKGFDPRGKTLPEHRFLALPDKSSRPSALSRQTVCRPLEMIRDDPASAENIAARAEASSSSSSVPGSSRPAAPLDSRTPLPTPPELVGSGAGTWEPDTHLQGQQPPLPVVWKGRR